MSDVQSKQHRQDPVARFGRAGHFAIAALACVSMTSIEFGVTNGALGLRASIADTHTVAVAPLKLSGVAIVTRPLNLDQLDLADFGDVDAVN